MIQDINRWCQFGFYFALGLVLANLSRLGGFTLFYLGSSLAIAGYLFASSPADIAEEKLAMRRTNGLAVLMTIFTFWDALLNLLFAPVTFGRAIFPAWQLAIATCSLIGGVFLLTAGRGRE